MKLKTYGILFALATASLFAEETLTLSDTDRAQSAPPSYTKDTKAPNQRTTPCTCEYPHRVQVGGSYAYNWITPEGNPTTSGNLGGVQALYEYRPLNSVYAAAAFHWRGGKTTKSGSSRTLDDFNVQERVGYTLPYRATCFRLSLFTGVGARYMAETVKVGDASAVFDYLTFYVPLGFLFERQIINALSIGCNFQWMPQALPMVRISPLSGTRWDLTYQLSNFFVEVPFKISPWKNGQLEFIIAPFFDYWKDGHTTATTARGLALNLPGNTYLFAGVNVNLAYSF